jgi:hypothetical protein
MLPQEALHSGLWDDRSVMMIPPYFSTESSKEVTIAEEGYAIGRLAAAAGANVETVRYYQRIQLMRVPKKASGGIRRYGTRKDLVSFDRVVAQRAMSCTACRSSSTNCSTP